MKKLFKRFLLGLGVIVIIGGGVAYTFYHQTSNYVLKEVISNQVGAGFTQATGIDLTESGRVLTQEEVEKVEVLFQAVEQVIQGTGQKVESNKEIEPKEEIEPTKEIETTKGTELSNQEESKPLTTDDVKQKLQEQVNQVINKIPAKDKVSMVNLVLGHIDASQINYLASLAADGISSADIEEAKRIARESYSPEQLEKIQAYYNQYSYLIP